MSYIDNNGFNSGQLQSEFTNLSTNWKTTKDTLIRASCATELEEIQLGVNLAKYILSLNENKPSWYEGQKEEFHKLLDTVQSNYETQTIISDTIQGIANVRISTPPPNTELSVVTELPVIAEEVQPPNQDIHPDEEQIPKSLQFLVDEALASLSSEKSAKTEVSRASGHVARKAQSVATKADRARNCYMLLKKLRNHEIEPLDAALKIGQELENIPENHFKEPRLMRLRSQWMRLMLDVFDPTSTHTAELLNTLFSIDSHFQLFLQLIVHLEKKTTIFPTELWQKTVLKHMQGPLYKEIHDKLEHAARWSTTMRKLCSTSDREEQPTSWLTDKKRIADFVCTMIKQNPLPTTTLQTYIPKLLSLGAYSELQKIFNENIGEHAARAILTSIETYARDNPRDPISKTICELMKNSESIAKDLQPPLILLLRLALFLATHDSLKPGYYSSKTTNALPIEKKQDGTIVLILASYDVNGETVRVRTALTGKNISPLSRKPKRGQKPQDLSVLAAAFKSAATSTTPHATWAQLSEDMQKKVTNPHMSQLVSEAARLIQTTSCTTKEYAFCCNLVGDLLNGDSSISLQKASLALGALIYCHDHIPQKVDSLLQVSTTKTVDTLVETASSEFVQIFKNHHPSNLVKPKNDFRLTMANGRKISDSLDQVDEHFYAQTLCTLFIGPDGKVNKLLIPLADKLLPLQSERSPFDEHLNSVFISFAKDPDFHTLLANVEVPQDPTLQEMIRSLVGITNNRTITKVDVAKALFTSLFLSWRQRYFGSCYVTALTLEAFALNLKMILKDLSSLYTRGVISRVIDGIETDFAGIPHKDNYYLDAPFASSTNHSDIFAAIMSIPGMEQALQSTHALDRTTNSTKTYLQMAIEAAQGKGPYTTLRKILDSLDTQHKIDVARFSFALEPPLRAYEAAIDSMRNVPFNQLGKAPYYTQKNQVAYFILLITSIFELLSKKEFENLEKEKVIAFFNTLPPQLAKSIYTAWQQKQRDPTNPVEIDLEGLDPSVYEYFSKRAYKDFPFLQDFRLFAISSREGASEHPLEPNEGAYRAQLYAQIAPQKYEKIDKSHLEAILNGFVKNFVHDIDPSFTFPKCTIQDALDLYATSLETASPKQARFDLHAPEPTHGAASMIYTTFGHYERLEHEYTNRTPAQLLTNLIDLKVEAGENRTNRKEYILAANNNHVFGVDLTRLPDTTPELSSETFTIETTRKTQEALLESIRNQCAEFAIDAHTIETYLQTIIPLLPKNGTLKNWFELLQNSIQEDLHITIVLDVDALLTGLKKDSFNVVYPFGDTNYAKESQFCFYYNPLEEPSWQIGAFSSKNRFIQNVTDNFTSLAVYLNPPTLQQMEHQALITTEHQLEREMVALGDAFTSAWEKFTKSRPSREGLGTLLTTLERAESFEAMYNAALAANSPLTPLLKAKYEYEQKLKELLRKGNPPVRSALQPLFATCFGRATEMRDALMSDLATFKTLIL